jgi:hypothetical protein
MQANAGAQTTALDGGCTSYAAETAGLKRAVPSFALGITPGRG